MSSAIGIILSICLWNENKDTSANQFLKAGHVSLRFKDVENVFVARAHTLHWWDELMVNEHMTFFLHAKREAFIVGKLSSQDVSNMERDNNLCYR